MVKPGKDDLLTEDGFFDFVSKGQTYNTPTGPRSTAAINGTQQYAATTHTVSEVLQGSLIQSSPSDTLLVLNKALTDKLKYMDEEGLSTLSTFSGEKSAFAPGGGAAAAGVPAGAAGAVAGTLNEQWVLSLPDKHANGALIWQSIGMLSLEMHLGTSDNIETDKSQHKQSPTLPEGKRHPYYMDRIGGPRGGENHTPGNVSTGTEMGESANIAGLGGAFGYLSPEEEQWYCSMAWPYKGGAEAFDKAGRSDIAALARNLKQSDYRGKRILVYCKDTQKGVVCTPGDWGPFPYFTNGSGSGELNSSINGYNIGVSPDVMEALRGSDNVTKGGGCIVKFMPDETALGPYNATNAQEGQATGGGGASSTDTATTATGTSIVNTLEEFKYAGQKIANHPNLVTPASSLIRSLTEGFQSGTNEPTKYIPAWFPEINRGFYMPSLLNYLWFILEYGCKINGSLGQGYVHRPKNSSNSLSNHAKGGALDIGGIGFGSSVGYSDPQWRPHCDKLFGYLSGLPRESRASEIGCSYDFMYPNSFHVYKDKNPNHLHIGFNENQVGRLIPVLKGPTSTPVSQGLRRPS